MRQNKETNTEAIYAYMKNNDKWHACLNSCTRYVFNLGVKSIQTINVFQYARLGQESHTEHNGKAYNAYDFLHGKSKSSVEAVEQ